MPDSTLDAVRERFDRDARNFDAIYRLERSRWSRWFNLAFRKAVFERYEMTFAEAGDVTGKSILDIGCGSGVYSVDFARRGARHVLGVDFSANMIALAREEAANHRVENVCQFVAANFLDYDVKQPFDISIAIGVFDYLPDPTPFLRKMAAATTEKLIVSLPGHSLVREPARKLRYKLTRRGTVHFYSRDDVTRLATEAGLPAHRILPIHTSGTGFLLVGELR